MKPISLEEIESPTDIAAQYYMPFIEKLCQSPDKIALDLTFFEAFMLVQICQVAHTVGFLEGNATEPYCKELGQALSQLIATEVPELRQLLEMGWMNSNHAHES